MFAIPPFSNVKSTQLFPKVAKGHEVVGILRHYTAVHPSPIRPGTCGPTREVFYWAAVATLLYITGVPQIVKTQHDNL
jgi:hypothetical protein